MAQPSVKSFKVNSFLEAFSQDAFGTSRAKSIENDRCVKCGGESIEFRNAISLKEFTISGFCQTCQDKIFGVGF